MSGIIEVCREAVPALLHSLTAGIGTWVAGDCLMQLSFVYIQAWIIPHFLLQLLVDPLTTLTALPLTALYFYCSTIAIGAVSLLLEKRMTWRKVIPLLLYPLFIFSFLPLQTLSLILPYKVWKPIHHTGIRMQP